MHLPWMWDPRSFPHTIVSIKMVSSVKIHKNGGQVEKATVIVSLVPNDRLMDQWVKMRQVWFMNYYEEGLHTANTAFRDPSVS